MMLCWYTRSMEDERPKGSIHAYSHGDQTLCGIEFSGPRWFIAGGDREVTCPKCKTILACAKEEQQCQ